MFKVPSKSIANLIRRKQDSYLYGSNRGNTMDSKIVLTITLVVMFSATPMPSNNGHVKKGHVVAIPMKEPEPLYVPPGEAGEDRMDISRQGHVGGFGGHGGGFGGHGGHGGFPFPVPGFGSMFGHRQLPFEAISVPYVSSSIGPAFSSTGPLSGLGMPFSPGPLGGIMGIPLAMIAMG